MSKYSKFIMAIIGSLVGALLMFLNNQFGIDLGGAEAPITAAIVGLLASLGVIVGPANTP